MFYSCDEYPFATTVQGGNSAPDYGRSYSWCNIPRFPIRWETTGFSACFIPHDQNMAGGALISPFNRENRILYSHDDPFDGYFVQSYHN